MARVWLGCSCCLTHQIARYDKARLIGRNVNSRNSIARRSRIDAPPLRSTQLLSPCSSSALPSQRPAEWPPPSSPAAPSPRPSCAVGCSGSYRTISIDTTAGDANEKKDAPANSNIPSILEGYKTIDRMLRPHTGFRAAELLPVVAGAHKVAC